MNFGPKTNNLFTLLSFGALMLQISCGAPLKSADGVEGVFKEARTLEDKVSGLCKDLRGRAVAPYFGNFRMSDELCSKPGLNYVNYNDLAPDQSLRFSAVRANSEVADTNGQQKADAIFNMQTRTELFLNRSVLELAKSLMGSLDKKTQAGEGESADAKFSMEIIGKPQFDLEKFTFRLEFRMHSSKEKNGQVDIDNYFQVYGELFNNESIAVDIATKDLGDVTKTIIRDGKIVVFIIPHAGDIYMDIGTDINYHSFGVDEVMKESIKSTLGSGLRSIPELVADANKT